MSPKAKKTLTPEELASKHPAWLALADALRIEFRKQGGETGLLLEEGQDDNAGRFFFVRDPKVKFRPVVLRIQPKKVGSHSAGGWVEDADTPEVVVTSGSIAGAREVFQRYPASPRTGKVNLVKAVEYARVLFKERLALHIEEKERREAKEALEKAQKIELAPVSPHEVSLAAYKQAPSPDEPEGVDPGYRIEMGHGYSQSLYVSLPTLKAICDLIRQDPVFRRKRGPDE